MTDDASRVGTLLGTKWHLDALLGSGGVAAVYSATHRNGSQAAIKIMHRELSSLREVRARFLREGYMANRVDHPAVVRALDDDEVDGTPYIVFELVHGDTLARRAQEEAFGAAELLAVADQVLPALIAGHARGITHQDLKPENLLVDSDGRVRVLDYGIARTIEDHTTERFLLHSTGTPSFMSPEQVHCDSAIGPASDIYSLGATLFALATGRPPHVASTTPHLLVKVYSERAPRVRRLAPDLPEELGALIDRALERDPKRRWSSASEMLAEVKRIYAVLGITPSPLVLACRHADTQPNSPNSIDGDMTGGVGAIVVSTRPPRLPLRRAKRPYDVWLAVIVVVAAVAGGGLGRLRKRAPPARPAETVAVQSPIAASVVAPPRVTHVAPIEQPVAATPHKPVKAPPKKVVKPRPPPPPAPPSPIATAPRDDSNVPGEYKSSPY